MKRIHSTPESGFSKKNTLIYRHKYHRCPQDILKMPQKLCLADQRLPHAAQKEIDGSLTLKHQHAEHAKHANIPVEKPRKALRNAYLSGATSYIIYMRRPIFGLSRHRMGIDGKGITTLVTFMGCPLACKYCLNERCHDSIFEDDGQTLKKDIRLLSPQALYDVVKKDNIYFQTTGGGICFGGGEPTLQADFITAFALLLPKNWKLTLETSLHCPCSNLQALASYVDEWIVDIKDANPQIYEAYTGQKPIVMQRLEKLMTYVPNERILVKVPLIPDFNTPDDVKRSTEVLKEMGLRRIVETEYVKPIPHPHS